MSIVKFVVKNCGTCQGDPAKCVKKCAYFTKKPS